MLSKCANPACSNVFRYFHEGKLYLVDSKTASTESRALEYFWLCSGCCREMTIEIDHGHAVTVFSKPAEKSDLAQPSD